MKKKYRERNPYCNREREWDVHADIQKETKKIDTLFATTLPDFHRNNGYHWPDYFYYMDHSQRRFALTNTCNQPDVSILIRDMCSITNH